MYFHGLNIEANELTKYRDTISRLNALAICKNKNRVNFAFNQTVIKAGD
jgi:hypothetical protein